MGKVGYAFNIGLALVFLATLIFAVPYLGSALWLYEGHLSLNRAIEARGLDPDTWSLPAALTQGTGTGAPPAEAAQAVGYLQQAARWDKNNEQAHRDLVSAYVLQQDYAAAAEALRAHSRFVPLDRGRYLLLAQLYGNGGQVDQAVEAWRQAGVGLTRDQVGDAAVQGARSLPPAAFILDPAGGTQVATLDGKPVIGMYTVSKVEKVLVFNAPGEYQIQVRAQQGTPPPIELAVLLDDAEVGRLLYGAGNNAWTDQELRVKIGAGWHLLSIKYVNDLFAPSVDRNAFIEEVRVAPAR